MSDIKIPEGYEAVIDGDRIKFVKKEPDNYVDWELMPGDWYFRADINGWIAESYSSGDEIDRFFTSYPTKELAEKAFKLMRRSNAYIKACLLVDPDFEPDWDDDSQKKHYLFYDHKNKRHYYDYYCNLAISGGNVSTSEKARQAIELLKKWGVK